nr:tyrosine-type recombinase/integrase [Agromyces agglutinans]
MHVGKRVQATKSGFPTQKAAKQARADALADLEASPLSRRAQTVAVFLRDWITRKEADGDIRPSTAIAYRHHIESYLVPILGSMKLSEVRVQHLEHVQAELQRQRPNMSAATRARVHATLRSALRDAYRRELLRDDPTRRMKAPKADRPKVKVWQPEQYGRFLDWLHGRGDRLATAVHLAGMTGLRRGELCGLRWIDVDLERGRLVVAQQVTQLRGQVEVARTKTRAGESRVVDLDVDTIGLLRDVQAVHDAERAGWDRDYGLVLVDQDGRPLTPEHLTRGFPRAIRAYNAEQAGPALPLIRFHDLRHLQASLMLAAGVPLALVSKRLGHSSVQVTSDTYAHLLDGVGAAAAAAAAALIPRTSATRS